MNSDSRDSRNLRKFYELIDRLEEGLDGKKPCNCIYKESDIPEGGIYFIFEENENRACEQGKMRVVRVGKEVSFSGRWKQHWGQSNGGGNHRISAFRRRIGEAIISRKGLDVPTWDFDGIPRLELPKEEKEAEELVSKHIRERMQLLWVSIPLNDIIPMEKKSISFISNCRKPFDRPTSDWLGNDSPYEEVKLSGLWNIDDTGQYTGDIDDQCFLLLLEIFVRQTINIWNAR